MVTFIYFLRDSGIFHYSEPLEERLYHPKEDGKNIHYHYALHKMFRKN
jgi:hypothetical protein